MGTSYPSWKLWVHSARSLVSLYRYRIMRRVYFFESFPDVNILYMPGYFEARLLSNKLCPKCALKKNWSTGWRQSIKNRHTGICSETLVALESHLDVVLWWLVFHFLSSKDVLFIMVIQRGAPPFFQVRIFGRKLIQFSSLWVLLNKQVIPTQGNTKLLTQRCYHFCWGQQIAMDNIP